MINLSCIFAAQFSPLNLQDAATLQTLIELTDKAVGYVYAGLEEKPMDISDHHQHH